MFIETTMHMYHVVTYMGVEWLWRKLQFFSFSFLFEIWAGEGEEGWREKKGFELSL